MVLKLADRSSDRQSDSPMRALIFLAGLLAPGLAHADSWTELQKLDQQYERCMDGATANAEMGQCSYDAYEKADAILNKAYQVIVADHTTAADTDDEYTAEYNTETLRRLQETQRAWVAYRDAYCDLRGAEMLDGSGEGLIISGCLYEETVRQTKALLDQFLPRPE
jgi:uncharacterized protein YecT (DUF1311 family)